MTIIELKKYIYENNKIEYILEQIGCHHIKYHNKGYYTCSNKDGDNKTAINVYNDENLNCVNHTRDIGKHGNLINLVCFNMNLSFVQGIKYLHKLLGLKNDYNKNKKQSQEEKKIDPLEIFKKVKRKRNKININDIEIFDSTIIEEYEPVLYIDWLKEDGIVEFTRKRFNIGYSYKHKRIIIPIRYWAGEENDYIGIIGRTTVKNYDLFDIVKYCSLKPYLKTINLYGLQENYKSIQDSGYVCVYESEKGVLKRHSRLDGTGVAVGSHNLSDEQVKILIGINCNIVIAYDKDIPLKHIRSECSRFYGIRNIFYIYDKHDLLKEKESPSDANNKIFNYLLKYKVKYDEKEHKEHLKEIADDKKKR